MMNTNAKIIVNNVPDYVEKDNVCVARVVDNELWFYGAYNSEEEAKKRCFNILGESAVLFMI